MPSQEPRRSTRSKVWKQDQTVPFPAPAGRACGQSASVPAPAGSMHSICMRAGMSRKAIGQHT
eukprot:1159473-Pelagomonas_calceolata.AAC.3